MNLYGAWEQSDKRQANRLAIVRTTAIASVSQIIGGWGVLSARSLGDGRKKLPAVTKLEWTVLVCQGS